MPNCDFYATLEDHKVILDFLFQNNESNIYELDSDFGQQLKQFHDSDEIINQFNRKYSNGKIFDTIYLQIFVKNSGHEFKPTYVKLNPKSCNGHTFRYSAQGYGLIQLYLSINSENALKNSHTNHFNFKSASKWNDITEDSKINNEWDFDKINKFSLQLNKFIKKLGVAKIGSRIITKNALNIWNEGCNFSPFNRENIKIEMLK